MALSNHPALNNSENTLNNKPPTMKIPRWQLTMLLLQLTILAMVSFDQAYGFWSGLTSWIPSMPQLPWTKINKLKAALSNEPRDYGYDLGNFTRFPASKAFKLPPPLPSGFYPARPETIGVKFYLYTCQNKYRPYIIRWNDTDEVVKASPFDAKKRSIFIIHGFQDLYTNMNWMGDMKDFILGSRGNEQNFNCHHNVFAVDWHNGSQVKLYPKAVANTMIVGAVVARHIKQLIRLYGKKPTDFSVVGHSLGAHISGFVGKRFQKKGRKLRNILGLDPAGPGFTDVSDAYRLNPNDARLVLTIHTNGGKVLDCFGMIIPLGHYSFFPNGGHQQTGCEKTKAISNILLNGVVGGLTDTIACSHRRATQLVQFNQSLLTYAQAVAYLCDSYEEYTSGKCGNCKHKEDCKPFSDWFTWWQDQLPPKNWTEPITYYVDTTNMIPWTMFVFQVIVEVKSVEHFRGGALKIEPIGRLRDGPAFIIKDTGSLKPKIKYTHLLKVPKDLGKVTHAYVSLVHDDQHPSNFSKVVVKSMTFNYLSNINYKVRQEMSDTLYSKKPIGVGERVLFDAKDANKGMVLDDKLNARDLQKNEQ